MIQQWEYEVQDFFGTFLPNEYLRGFGANGWELCFSQVISDPVSEINGTRHFFLIFKRPVNQIIK